MQGNAAANAAFEQVATGCLKPIGPVSNPENASALLAALFNPVTLFSSFLTSPQNTILVPGDPNRRFVSKKQYKDVFKAGKQTDGHGFNLIDAAQETASKGAAGYYAWSPAPGMRFIALDTVAEAGTILTPTGKSTSDGNIDDPQFKWLRAQLQAATAADQLVVLFSHHAPESLVADVPDELAPPCTVNDSHGHDINPGCDLDPRLSLPDPPTGRRGQPPARIPERDRLGCGSLPRQPRQRLPQPGRTRRLLEHPRRRRGRLAPAEPPARGLRQPRRHPLDLRHDPRPRRPGGSPSPRNPGLSHGLQ